MKNLLFVLFLPLVAGLGACSASVTTTQPATEFAQQVDVTLTPDTPRETILIVSLEDGSVIMQTIQSNADLCFKTNWESATTCLTQGDPVVDPATNTVIGFEMIEDHIELVAKSD